MKKNIPDISVPIIKSNSIEIKSLKDEFHGKKIILFGIPGAFHTNLFRAAFSRISKIL